jgi:hypothetical protein
LKYLSGSTFFGLSLNNVSEIRKDLFLQIHDICFWGQGGYDFSTVYNLPIWLRKFILLQLRQHYDKTNNSEENNLKKSIETMKNNSFISPPPVSKSINKLLYQTEASKK